MSIPMDPCHENGSKPVSAETGQTPPISSPDRNRPRNPGGYDNNKLRRK